MPHLAYLGQMLEKGGGFVVGTFPKGLVLSRDCPNPLKLHIYSLLLCQVVKCLWFVNSTDTHISLSHTVHNREIWDTCKGRYAGLCPRYGALFH